MRSTLVTALRAVLVLGMALVALGGPVSAQTTSVPPTPPANGEPSQDILIEGLGFSKLILDLQVEQALNTNSAFLALVGMLEKDLCWSGLFNLAGGRTSYCHLRSKPERIDMRLLLGLEGQRLTLRLHDSGPESLLLFKDTLPLDGTVDEEQIMELINRLTERITGQPGLLGSTIAFSLRQPGYNKVIVATTTQGQRLQLLSHNPDINLLPRFNRQGTAVVYTVLGRRGSRVYYQNLLPNSRGAMASHYLTPPGSLNTGGTFSPDDTKLVLTMSVSQSADLFLLNLDTNKRRRLTARSGIETQANWSHDGNKLVFVSDRSGTPQIYLYDMETGEDLRLTFDGAYNTDPKWSPDDKSILFTKREATIDQIYIMDQYGENQRAVTRGPYDSEQAEWSPDGRQVVFASNRTGDFKLYVVSADGSNLRRLTHTPKGFGENSATWTFRRLIR